MDTWNLKKIETDGNCAFWKLLLTYQFFGGFVMFDILLGRHVFDTKLWFWNLLVISQVPFKGKLC